MVKEYPLSREYIDAMLTRNGVTKYVENIFISKHPRANVQDAHYFLHIDMEVPMVQIRTASTPGKYFDHYVFYFAPSASIELEIEISLLDAVLKDMQKMDLSGTVAYRNINKTLDAARLRKTDTEIKYADNDKIYKSTVVAIVFENRSGHDIDDPTKFTFKGVFGVIPNQIM